MYVSLKIIFLKKYLCTYLFLPVIFTSLISMIMQPFPENVPFKTGLLKSGM